MYRVLKKWIDDKETRTQKIWKVSASFIRQPEFATECQR